jgi:CDP-L-myo-inositol myo-inositolphosphotransferase
MEGEKSGGRPVLLAFASAAEAGRRVAGVAAAARLARDFASAGRGPVWIGWPGGADLPRAAAADLARLAPDTRIADPATRTRLERAGADLVAAPKLTSLDVLRATGKASDGPVSRRLNRPLSRRLSALLLLWPAVRPVHATLGTAALAAAMFAALMLGGSGGLVAGGLLFQAASVFDGVDGEIARATWRSSARGAALDSLVDVATNFLFIAGVTFNLAAQREPLALPVGGWGLAGFAIGLVILGWRAARGAAALDLDRLKAHWHDRAAGAAASGLIRFLTTVSSRDFFALLFAVLVVAGRPMAVLWIFAAAATVWLPFLLASLAARPGPAPGNA